MKSLTEVEACKLGGLRRWLDLWTKSDDLKAQTRLLTEGELLQGVSQQWSVSELVSWLVTIDFSSEIQ